MFGQVWRSILADTTIQTSEIIVKTLSDPKVAQAFLSLTPKQAVPQAPRRTSVFSIQDLS